MDGSRCFLEIASMLKRGSMVRAAGAQRKVPSAALAQMKMATHNTWPFLFCLRSPGNLGCGPCPNVAESNYNCACLREAMTTMASSFCTAGRGAMTAVAWCATATSAGLLLFGLLVNNEPTITNKGMARLAASGIFYRVLYFGFICTSLIDRCISYWCLSLVII